jgi:hypothetical protein
MNDVEILYWWIGIYWEVFKSNIFYFMLGWVPPCDFIGGHYIFIVFMIEKWNQNGQFGTCYDYFITNT